MAPSCAAQVHFSLWVQGTAPSGFQRAFHYKRKITLDSRSPLTVSYHLCLLQWLTWWCNWDPYPWAIWAPRPMTFSGWVFLPVYQSQSRQEYPKCSYIFLPAPIMQWQPGGRSITLQRWWPSFFACWSLETENIKCLHSNSRFCSLSHLLCPQAEFCLFGEPGPLTPEPKVVGTWSPIGRHWSGEWGNSCLTVWIPDLGSPPIRNAVSPLNQWVPASCSRVPCPHRALPPCWLFSCVVSWSFSCSIKPAASGWCSVWCNQWSLHSWAFSNTFFAVKWVAGK